MANKRTGHASSTGRRDTEMPEIREGHDMRLEKGGSWLNAHARKLGCKTQADNSRATQVLLTWYCWGLEVDHSRGRRAPHKGNSHRDTGSNNGWGHTAVGQETGSEKWVTEATSAVNKTMAQGGRCAVQSHAKHALMQHG